MRRIASILALLPALAFAQTPLTTADDWQAAVQTAAPSSWFAFAAGTYTTTGTALTVTSGWTRIQGAGPGQSYLTSGHATNWGVVQLTGPEIVLDGFTVYGGSTSNRGGGVQGTGGQTVTNCHVVSNKASVGGGTYLVNVRNSLIADNLAYNYLRTPPPGYYSGGGVLLGPSNVASKCVVSNNMSYVDGGGISASGRTHGELADDCDVVANRSRDGCGMFYGTATNCRIVGNSNAPVAIWQGGGGTKHVKIYNSLVASNTTSKAGGGVLYGFAVNSEISGNSASGSGGGMAGAPALGCVVSGNVSGGRGGGMDDGGSTNCAIVGNSATNNGGGVCRKTHVFGFISGNVSGAHGGGAHEAAVYCSTLSSNYASFAGGANNSVLESCAIYGNHAANKGDESYGSHLINCTVITTNGKNAVVLYSASRATTVANTLIVGTTNALVDEVGAAWTNVSHNVLTNEFEFLPEAPAYRLHPDSPLIDAGSGDFGSYPLDLWGRYRTYLGGDPDIGATEWTATDLPPDNGAARKRRIIGLLFGKDN